MLAVVARTPPTAVTVVVVALAARALVASCAVRRAVVGAIPTLVSFTGAMFIPVCGVRSILAFFFHLVV